MERPEIKPGVLHGAAAAAMLLAFGCGVDTKASWQPDYPGKGFKKDCPVDQTAPVGELGGVIIADQLVLTLTKQGERQIKTGTSIEDTGIPVLNEIVRINGGKANLTRYSEDPGDRLRAGMYVLEFGAGLKRSRPLVIGASFDSRRGIVRSGSPEVRSVQEAVKILYCNPDDADKYVQNVSLNYVRPEQP